MTETPDAPTKRIKPGKTDEPATPKFTLDDVDTGLRGAINFAVDNAIQRFCEDVERYARRHGFTDEYVTKSLRVMHGSEWLEWWEEWIAEEEDAANG